MSKADRITEMFEEGKRFTEELMQENERLRVVVLGLEDQVRELSSESARAEAPRLKERLRLLEQENLLLHEELQELKEQYASVEKENWDFSERYLHVDQQNSTLLNLYVAVQGLHAALQLDEAVSVVKEIVVNLVGSESFDVWVIDRERSVMTPIASEGGEPRTPRELDAVTARVVETGVAYVRGGDAEASEGPVACVPMKLGDWVLGVIVIEDLLAQKAQLEPTDHELLELLADHAAVTLCAAHLFASAGGRSDGGRARLARELAARAGQQLVEPV